MVWIGRTSEVITPRPITPTFGYTNETHPHSGGSWSLTTCGRDVSWWCVVEGCRGRGGADMRKIRVIRLRGVVWLELSPGRVCMDSCPQERGGECCCIMGCMLSSVMRGSKAPGSKYLPRRARGRELRREAVRELGPRRRRETTRRMSSADFFCRARRPMRTFWWPSV